MTASLAEPSITDRQLFVGRACVVGAAVFWSLNGLFAKAPIFDVWPGDDRGTILAFWRAAFAGLWLLPLVRRPRWSWKLLPMVAAFAAMNVSFLQSMSLTTAANAGWLQAMAPLWVFVFAVWVWREPFDRRSLLPLMFGLAGVGTILVRELMHSSAGDGSLLGASLGVASGVFFALVVVSMRGLRDENSAWLLALSLLATAAILGPYCLGKYGMPSGQQLGILAAFGLVQMALPYLLLARGLRVLGSQEVAAIGLVEPVLVPIWVYLAWGEVPAVTTFFGGALILAGLWLRYRRGPLPA
ncbi:MAG TPA: DMT family transporter [Pirellulales bacterium]|nr:DMT family transporter [Pirellulales bacterium]